MSNINDGRNPGPKISGLNLTDRPLLAHSVLSIILSGWFHWNTYTGIKYHPILPENGFCLNDFSIKSFTLRDT
ncbi:MAG TPA: hypothetical protein VIJ25_03310 [Methylococcales bacterium]